MAEGDQDQSLAGNSQQMGSVTICNREALNVPLMIGQPLCNCFGRHVTKVTVE
jgi:hypothetical protein